MVTSGYRRLGGRNWEGHGKRPSETGAALILELGGDFVGMLILRKFMERCVYNLCTFI